MLLASIEALNIQNIKLENVIKRVCLSSTLLGFSLQLPVDIQPVFAASPQTYIYKSGKAPYLATGKPPDTKDDKAVGGKKETNFLRALSNCKTRCQQPGEGLAKGDCVQDCQDQTCNSYEQCSFRIKASMGNAI